MAQYWYRESSLRYLFQWTKQLRVNQLKRRIDEHNHRKAFIQSWIRYCNCCWSSPWYTSVSARCSPVNTKQVVWVCINTTHTQPWFTKAIKMQYTWNNAGVLWFKAYLHEPFGWDSVKQTRNIEIEIRLKQSYVKCVDWCFAMPNWTTMIKAVKPTLLLLSPPSVLCNTFGVVLVMFFLCKYLSIEIWGG